MSQQAIYETIKKTVLSYLPDARVMLFGSHAKGAANRHSDYDLLIITPRVFEPREKINQRSIIHKALLRSIHAPFDVLLFSEEEIEEKKEWPGHIVRSAMREGVAL